MSKVTTNEDFEWVKNNLGKKSVLFVEDEPILRKITATFLRKIFDQVDLASNGAEAFDLYKHQYHDLVITDLVMPYMGGVELVRGIRQVNKDQMIVVLSGHQESHYLLDLINLGVHCFVEKPLKLEAFSSALRRLGQTMLTETIESHYRERLQEMNNQLIRTNDDLARAMEKLKGVDQLKDDFLATVSHELRTPIMSIVGYAEAIHDLALSVEKQKEFSQTIIDEGERLSRLVDNILDTSSLSAGTLEVQLKPCRLQPIIDQAIRAVEGVTLRAHLKIATAYEDFEFLGDDQRLIQVLVNLLGNAIKYSPDGGTIHLSAQSQETTFTIAIQDEGAGLPDEELEQIFQRFYKVSNNARRVKGSGLGLTVAKGIVEKHGGEIWAANSPNGGAIFYVSLPLPKAMPVATESSL